LAAIEREDLVGIKKVFIAVIAFATAIHNQVVAAVFKRKNRVVPNAFAIVNALAAIRDECANLAWVWF
jgi:hypothetical protein